MPKRRDPNEPRLVPVAHIAQAVDILWQLLEERPPEANISHAAMPTWQEHCSFVNRYPYRSWWLIQAQGEFVGAIYLTRHWEIGISVLKDHQRKGYAKWAIREVVRRWAPKAERRANTWRGRFLANVAPANEASKRLFEELGFRCLQHTYAVDA